MRRRRPSALYSVLDEEQLLGGVDLADHPDPRAADGRADRGPEDRDEWAPSCAGESTEWNPDEADGLVDWSPDDAGAFGEPEPAGRDERPSPGTSGSAVATRRRRVALGTLGALILILLVVRGIGSVLAGVGERAGSRQPSAGPSVGALSSLSGDPGGPTKIQSVRRRAHRSDGSPPMPRPRAKVRHDPHVVGSSRRSEASVPQPSRSAASTLRPRSSPEQEFGFER